MGKQARSWALAGAGAAAIAALVFGPHLHGDFVWDDAALLAKNPDLQLPGHLAHLLTSPIEPGASVYRPLTMATFWIQARLSGVDVPSFRAVGIALHAGVALALLALLRRLGVATLAALAAAGNLLVHPSVTEPVMWLDGRHDTLGALLALAALLAWIPAEGAAPTPARRAASVALTALSVLCKEVFVVVPLLLALDGVRRAVGARARPPGVDLAWLAAPAAAVAACFGLRAALGIPGGGLAGASPVAFVQTWGIVIDHYAVQLVSLGNGPTVETFVDLGPGRAAAAIAILAAALAGLVALARRGSRAAGVAALGLAWFAIALAPAAIAIPIAGQYANRYAYFPWAGLAVALAAGLDGLLARDASPTRARAVAGGAAFACAVLAFRTSAEAALWRDEASLFGADVQRLPGDGRALFHFAVDVQRREGCAAALPLFARAAELAPGYVRAWHNLAGCLVRERRFAEAVGPARRAVALDPGTPRRHYNLGLALAGAGDPAGAEACFARAVALDPGYAPAQKELLEVRRRRAP